MIVEFKIPNLYVFKRDINNNRVVERIPLEDFRHYFMVGKDEEIPNSPKILKIEDGKKSLFGEETKKIICESPFDVSQIRNLFYKSYEADIRFHDRFLLDKIKELPSEKLRKCFFDIETDGFPDIVRSDKRITAICCYDNYTEKYYSFVLGDNYRTEEDLLSAVIEHIKTFDYDILTAHNGDRFDFPVWIGRMMNLSLNFSRLSPIGIVKREQWKGEWRCKIAGRILFDFLGAKTSYGTKGGIRGLLDGRDLDGNLVGQPDKVVRIKRWGLAYLAQFIGMEKGSYKECETPQQLKEYNKLDVEIMVALDKKFNVIEYYHNMQILIGCAFEHTYFNTNMIDMFLLRRYSQYAFPTKVHGRGNSIDIEGATVDEPIKGLYPVVKLIDQLSLYPTAIFSGNMSPEKLSVDGDIDLKNGARFSSDGIGIIPDAVKFLLDIRIKYKEMSKTEKDPSKSQMFKLLSDGYKILLVSFYGALLYQGFRLYNQKIAESIPYIGRKIKEHVRKIIEKYNYKIIAGDTDSNFIIPLKENCININELVDIINKSFDEFAKEYGMKYHIFRIEVDKEYEPLLMGDSKKRYVGYIKKGDKKIYKATGYESVRRDTPEITEHMQETLFKMILDGKNRKDLETYIEELKNDIITGKYSLTEIMIRKGFSKKFNGYKVDTPHVRGATYSNENLGTHFDEYSDLGVIYVKRVPEGKQQTDVVAIDEETKDILKDFIIDWDVMIDKVVTTKSLNVLKILGWDSDTKQKSLFDFGGQYEKKT